ncbi:MAG: tetratricopeptide repeat protein [Planctomycetota bacterium]
MAVQVGEAAAKPDYDPARAFLALAELEVLPPPPQTEPAPSGSGRQPLSERGAEYLGRAEELIAEERYTEATGTLEKALRSDPASAELHRALALAAHGAGNQERARSHAVEAVRLDADDLPSHYVLGRTAFDARDYGEAIRHLRTGLACTNRESFPGYAALTDFYLAKSLEAEGYLTAALEAYRSFEQRAADETRAPARAAPQELTTLLRLNQGSAAGAMSVIYERFGRFGDAAEALGPVLLREPRLPGGGPREPGENDLATRLRYIRLLTAARRYEDALAQCRIAAGESADPGPVMGLLTELRARMGTPRMVLDDVGAVVRTRPDDRGWLLGYADLLNRFGQGEEAARILADYIAAHPEASDIAWRLCDDYIRAGRGVDAFEHAARRVAVNRREFVEALARVDRLTPDRRMVESIFAAVPPQARGGTAARPTPEAQYLLGVLALRTGRTQQGAELLQGVLDAVPDFAPARLALAEQLLAEFRWQEAVDLLEAEGPRDANLEWALGQAYAGLDDDERAAGHYSAAIRLNRADTRSMFALGQLYERIGQPLRAQRQYEALLEVDPLHVKAREVLVGLLLDSRVFDDAEARLRELRKLAASPNCLARCEVRMQLARGEIKVDECRRTLLEAMAQGGPDADSLALVASIDIARGEAAAAEQGLRQVLEMAPDHLDARELLTWVYRRQLRFPEAASELRGLLGRHPNRSRWVNSLYEVLLVEQDYASAADLVSSFLQRLEARAGARAVSAGLLREWRLKLLQALGGEKRFDAQIAALQAWLREDESDRALRGALVDAHLAAGDKTAALILTRQRHLADPADDQAADTYRQVLVQTGRFTAAAQLTLEALERDPASEGWQRMLVGVLASADRFDDALELIESSRATAHQTFELLIYQVDIYSRARRYEEAAALAHRLLQDDVLQRGAGPLDQVLQRRVLARAVVSNLLAARRYDEALAKLTRWIEQAESSDDKFLYLKLLSGVYHQRGMDDEALESLELAYALNPSEPEINNDLGYTLAERGARLDQAERMTRLAVAHEPTNTAYLDSLGWVLYRRGGFEAAREWLLKATRSLEGLEDPVIYDHLGDACWRLGVHDEAAEHWRKARQLAEQRLKEQDDPVERRVLQSVAEKLQAVEAGQLPQVAPVAEEK